MSDIFERILMLKRSPMFTEVSTDDLRVVARALMEELFVAGERVFDINEQGEHMYVIEAGRVGISIEPDVGAKQFIAVLGSGDCFGEMGILEDRPRSATAHVLEDARLLALEKSRLRGLIVQYPELALGMLRGLSARLRQTTAMIKR